MVLCGTEEGALCAWDLREPLGGAAGAGAAADAEDAAEASALRGTARRSGGLRTPPSLCLPSGRRGDAFGEPRAAGCASRRRTVGRRARALATRARSGRFAFHVSRWTSTGTSTRTSSPSCRGAGGGRGHGRRRLAVRVARARPRARRASSTGRGRPKRKEALGGAMRAYGMCVAETPGGGAGVEFFVADDRGRVLRGARCGAAPLPRAFSVCDALDAGSAAAAPPRLATTSLDSTRRRRSSPRRDERVLVRAPPASRRARGRRWRCTARPGRSRCAAGPTRPGPWSPSGGRSRVLPLLRAGRRLRGVRVRPARRRPRRARALRGVRRQGEDRQPRARRGRAGPGRAGAAPDVPGYDDGRGTCTPSRPSSRASRRRRCARSSGSRDARRAARRERLAVQTARKELVHYAYVVYVATTRLNLNPTPGPTPCSPGPGTRPRRRRPPTRSRARASRRSTFCLNRAATPTRAHASPTLSATAGSADRARDRSHSVAARSSRGLLRAAKRELRLFVSFGSKPSPPFASCECTSGNSKTQPPVPFPTPYAVPYARP